MISINNLVGFVLVAVFLTVANTLFAQAAEATQTLSNSDFLQLQGSFKTLFNYVAGAALFISMIWTIWHMISGGQSSKPYIIGWFTGLIVVGIINAVF